MKADFFGTAVIIPNGYSLTEDGTYINGHGVEYQIVEYGRGENSVICLETIYGKHTRTIELERS